MYTIRPQPKSRIRSKLGHVLANALIVSGLLLITVVGALYVYQVAESQRFASEAQQRREAFEVERAALARERRVEEGRTTLERERQVEEERALAREQPAQDELVAAEEPPNQEEEQAERQELPAAPLAVFLPAVKPSPTPTRAPGSTRARRIAIPAIEVDSEVVDAEIRNGEWIVPKFVVGHLQNTGEPGRPGNAVYSGHIQSIASGNVFARLGELELGDRIYLATPGNQYTYEVSEIKVVANTDISVVAGGDDPIVTLITCTGAWDFVKRDYLQRLIVVAKLFGDESPGRSPVEAR